MSLHVKFLVICGILSIFFICSSVARNVDYEMSEADKKKVALAMDLIEEELPVAGLSMDEILDLILARYKEKLKKIHEPKMLSTLTETTTARSTGRKIGEICGTSASLECGKKVLASLEEEMESMAAAGSKVSLSDRCLVRKEFLQCIERHRKNCRQMADNGIVPQLPPEDTIKNVQSRIWRALWTSGGCTLAN